MSGRYGFLSMRVSLRDDGYAEGKSNRACPIKASGSRTRLHAFAHGASCLKLALSAFSFGRVISSGPKVSGRLAPFCRRVQPLSLCDVVTMATQSIELELRENAPFGPWTGRCSQPCRSAANQSRDLRVFDQGRNSCGKSRLKHDGAV